MYMSTKVDIHIEANDSVFEANGSIFEANDSILCGIYKFSASIKLKAPLKIATK